MPATPCDHADAADHAESLSLASVSREVDSGESRCGDRLIDACDRALDTASLFEGFPDDRWIETRARS